MKLLAWLLLSVRWSGLNNLPAHGPAVVVTNHLGDSDAVVLFSALRSPPDLLGKIELHDYGIVGRLMRWYGVIWVHRGRPDKRALRAALDGLRAGRLILIAPEGRYSHTGALEPGHGGAAFLAIKAGVPIVPLALTGTENANVYPRLRRLQRPPVTLRVGPAFTLTGEAGHRVSVREGTRRIMESLAALLPAESRGAYR
jgi:1-acyl-sn-glycerol-3-phosphate acyltransferase